MSNLTLLKSAWDEYNEGDHDAWYALLDEAYEFHITNTLVTPARTVVGPQAYRTYLDGLYEIWPNLVMDEEEWIEAPDGNVVVMMDVKGTRADNGDRMLHRMAYVHAVVEGRARTCWEYANPQEARMVLGI
jgi:ketosteroid isomerase-like protein